MDCRNNPGTNPVGHEENVHYGLNKQTNPTNLKQNTGINVGEKMPGKETGYASGHFFFFFFLTLGKLILEAHS